MPNDDKREAPEAPLLLIRDWLRSHKMQCPRCGGASGAIYGTWLIIEGEVCCDNCWWPHLEGDRPAISDRLREATARGDFDARAHQEIVGG